MKKTLFACVMVVPVVALAAFWWETHDPGTSGMKMQDVTVVAAGVPLFFEENFDGPGYENTSTPGPWVETDPANGLDDASSTTSVTGSYSMFVDGTGVSGTNHYTVIDLGVGGPTNFFVRVYMMGINNGVNDDSWLGFSSAASPTPSSRQCGSVVIDKSSTTDFLFFNATGAGNSLTLSPDTWHRLEFHYPSMDYKLNGSSITNNTNTDPTPAVLRTILIGDGSGGGDDGNCRWDALAISTNDWIGP